MVQAQNQLNLEKILSKYTNADRGQLIPLLQEVQELQGYLSKDAMVKISEVLKLPQSKVYGVSSFYNQFRFEPMGKYLIQVCRGTACHVQGSVKILDVLQQTLKVKPGETTRDGLFSLEIVACIGACGLAPVIAINGEFFANLTPKKIESIINNFKKLENK